MTRYMIYDMRNRKNLYFDSILDARKTAIRKFVSLEDPVSKRRMVAIVNPSTMNILELIYPHNILGEAYWYSEKLDNKGNTYNVYRVDPKTGALKR